jgi:hypothetical protein
MTSDQLSAISAFELDQDAVNTFMVEQGIPTPEAMQPGQGGPQALRKALPLLLLKVQHPQNNLLNRALPLPTNKPGQPGSKPDHAQMQVASKDMIDALLTLLQSKVG